MYPVNPFVRRIGSVPELNAAEDALAQAQVSLVNLGGDYNLPGARDSLHEKVLALDAKVRGAIAKIPPTLLSSYTTWRAREEQFYQKTLNPLDYLENVRMVKALRAEYADQVAMLTPYVGPIDAGSGISVGMIAIGLGAAAVVALGVWYAVKVAQFGAGEIRTARSDAKEIARGYIGKSGRGSSKALARSSE